MNNRNGSNCRIRNRYTTALLAALATSWASLHAGDTLFVNSGFDSDASGWRWEDWSAAGSTAEFDRAKNSVVSGGPPTSGSLKLVSAFTSAPGYQQAVYTFQLLAPENFIGQIGAVAFDVKVDETSTTRADGDYGWLETILR